MVGIKIPAQHRAAITYLVSLPNEDFGRLISALAETKPTMEPRALACHAALLAKLDVPQVELLIQAIVSLLQSRDPKDLPTDQVAKDIAGAAAEANLAELQQAPATRSILEDRLRQLLDLEQPLGITSRAITVLSQHKNAYQWARILTDVRPIFSRGDHPVPVATMIVHNLEIAAHTNNRVEKIFVALDSQDIRRLAKVLDRALVKEESLRTTMQKTQLPYIDVVPEVD